MNMDQYKMAPCKLMSHVLRDTWKNDPESKRGAADLFMRKGADFVQRKCAGWEIPFQWSIRPSCINYSQIRIT